MKLFQNTFESNLLPYNGEIYINEDFLPSEEAKKIFSTLLNESPWQNDKVSLFGKQHILKRKVAFYGDKDLLYQYSQSVKQANAWTDPLLQIKNKIEELTKCQFNSCLLNLYHDGSEGMSWHSDNEKELGINPNIASISLGAERKFSWKHRITKEGYSTILKSGSLLLMKGEMQEYWVHSLPKSKKIKEPRINLSFRNILS